MKRISTLVCCVVLVFSFTVQAGGFWDAVKKSAGEVAVEVKKDFQYTVDQTLRNTFPAFTGVGRSADTPAGFSNEDVLLYGFKSCPYCGKVEKLLKDNRVHYIDKDVEQSKRAKKEWRKLGGKGVPVTVIGNQTMYGYSEEKIMALLKEQGFI